MFMKIIHFVASIALCHLAGLVGSFFTIPAIPTWFTALVKPSFSPPSWIFSPVWICLYTLMGISFFIVWSKGWDRPEVKKALTFFLIQLLLNVLWSVFFFGLRSPLAGLIEIFFLWAAILLTMHRFFKLSRWAGFLLAPYIVWVTFAFILNFNLWRLNP
jgi:tryptophan-rich sensory protein